MKKVLFLSVVVCGILLADSLEVTLSTLKFNYKEYNSGKVLDSENSSFSDLPGINIKFTKKIGKFILNPNFEYNRGTTHYNGATWGGTPLSLTKHNVYLYNLNLIGKYNLLEDKISTGKYNLYILGGLGYRFWNRSKSNYAGDYKEQYKWPYYSLGGETNIQFNSKFTIGLQAYYQKAINPKMKAYLGSGTTYNLGRTNGYRISIPVKYALKTNYGIVFRYTYDYWKINKSDIKNITLYGSSIPTQEPDSKTKNQYFNIGFYYNF